MLTLSRASTDAFEEHGTNATIDDIAKRAGMSRRTVHRWVEARDDLVFIHPRLWLEYFDEAIAEVPGEPVRARILHGARRVSEAIDADPEPVVRSMQVAMANPSLMRGYAVVSQQWIDRMASEFLRDSPDDHFRARVLGGALMGVIDAALSEWLMTTPRPELFGLISTGLDLLNPILE